MSNKVEQGDQDAHIATYKRNLEIIRAFSESTSCKNVARETAGFWSDALSICEVAEPDLRTRRLIRHVSSLLEITPHDCVLAQEQDLLDVLTEARQSIVETDQVSAGFDAFEHRIERLKRTLDQG